MARALAATVGSFNPVLTWDNPNPEATKFTHPLLWIVDLVFYRILGFHREYVVHDIWLFGIRIYSRAL